MGIKVLRYEIKNITRQGHLAAMEKQCRAEREKRRCPDVEGGRTQRSLGEARSSSDQGSSEETQQINEAEGAAQAILAIAGATSEASARSRDDSDPGLRSRAARVASSTSCARRASQGNNTGSPPMSRVGRYPARDVDDRKCR